MNGKIKAVIKLFEKEEVVDGIFIIPWMSSQFIRVFDKKLRTYNNYKLISIIKNKYAPKMEYEQGHWHPTQSFQGHWHNDNKAIYSMGHYQTISDNFHHSKNFDVYI